MPYYNHIKFYVENIARGIYPLWDPSCSWGGGPNEFFLRRIGEFNPFFGLIVLLVKAGFSYTSAYFVFLAVYYFIGLLGFFKLAEHLFRETNVACLAYLLLMFSSWGTKLFDTYINLIFVPMVWFFYFVLAFSRKPERIFFLGLTFTLMIIVTTYLPFYFMTVLLTFFLCVVLFYFKDLKIVFSSWVVFFKRDKALMILCSLALLLALLPGVLLYTQGFQGEIVLPGRHFESALRNEMALDMKEIQVGGIIIPEILEGLFSNLHEMRLNRFYMPVFVYILFLIGALIKMNKRLIFLLTLFSCVLLIGLTDAAPAVQFLYKYIFYFKYFRNFNYFLWFVLLPVFILMCAEHLRLFLSNGLKDKKSQYRAVVLSAGLHMGLAVFLSRQENSLISSYWVVGLSFVLFTFLFLKKINFQHPSIPLILIGFVALQPLQVYQALERNADVVEYPYEYDRPYLNFVYFKGNNPEKLVMDWPIADESVARTRLKMYYGLNTIQFLLENIQGDIFEEYMRFKFIVYDHVAYMDDKNISLSKIEKAWAQNRNIAFVSSASVLLDEVGPVAGEGATARVMTKDTLEFQVIKFDMNSIKLKTNFSSRKFLVYNDNFHSGWQAFVDGKRVDIARANVAFKGLWLEPGERMVCFRYGTWGRYFLGYLLSAVFMGVLASLVVLWFRSRPCALKESAL